MVPEYDEKTALKLQNLAAKMGAFVTEKERVYLPFGFSRELLKTKMPAEASEQEFMEAEASLYHWWWKFLRVASDQYPPKEGDVDADDILALYQDFGDLGDNFREWWQRRGRAACAERRGTSVRVLYDTEGKPHEEPEFVRTVILEVVMHVPLDEVKKDMALVLEEVHPGKALTVYKHRDSKRPLYPRIQKNDKTYPKLLKLLADKPKTSTPNWARMGRETLKDNKSNPTKSTRRLYQKAVDMIYYALRGNFPTDDTVLSADDEQ